jgi:hypothetical protein
LLLDIGNGKQPEGELCEQVVESPPPPPKAAKAGDGNLGVKGTTSVVGAREPDMEKLLALGRIIFGDAG